MRRAQPKPIPATLDNGYDSEAAVEALEHLGIRPVHRHGAPKALDTGSRGERTRSDGAGALCAKSAHTSRACLDARRKVIVEPVLVRSRRPRFRPFCGVGWPKSVANGVWCV